MGRVGASGTGASMGREARESFLAALGARGLLASDGVATTYGFPAWRGVLPGHEPQALMDAGGSQRRLVECACATTPSCAGQCAAWVERAFSSLGMGLVTGDANELYDGYCHFTDTGELLVGMVVAVPRHPFDADGWVHGHVGLYAGDGVVMDCACGRVRRVPLELWLSAYGVASEPRWGWLGAISLA